VTVSLGGVTQAMNEAFGGLFFSMAVAILLVYIVMVLVFNSLIDPLVIMFSLPLATIGAFPALFLDSATDRHQRLDRLPDADRNRRHQRHRLTGPGRATPAVKACRCYDALIQGGRTRVRPILMTAIATILALNSAGPGSVRGRDHRLGIGHGRDRRSLHLDLPDADVIPVD